MRKTNEDTAFEDSKEDKELRREQTEHAEEDKTLCTETADNDTVRTSLWEPNETPYKIHVPHGEPNGGNAEDKTLRTENRTKATQIGKRTIREKSLTCGFWCDIVYKHSFRGVIFCGGKRNERQNNACLHRVQAEKLRYEQKQKDDSRQSRALEVL